MDGLKKQLEFGIGASRTFLHQGDETIYIYCAHNLAACLSTKMPGMTCPSK